MRQIPEQSGECGVTQQAALDDGRQDGHFVEERLAEASTVIQVQREGVVTEHLERLVVMSVHVPCEEVEDGHVHEVEQSPPRVVRRNVPHGRAVVGVWKTRLLLCT